MRSRWCGRRVGRSLRLPRSWHRRVGPQLLAEKDAEGRAGRIRAGLSLSRGGQGERCAAPPVAELEVEREILKRATAFW